MNKNNEHTDDLLNHIDDLKKNEKFGDYKDQLDDLSKQLKEIVAWLIIMITYFKLYFFLLYSIPLKVFPGAGELVGILGLYKAMFNSFNFLWTPSL